MTSSPMPEERLQQLGVSLSESPSVVDNVMSKIDGVEMRWSVRPRRRLQPLANWKRLVAAAAVLLAVGFVGLRLLQLEGGHDRSDWWLASPSAWAGEITAAIEVAGRDGWSCNEQFIHVLSDGTRATSSSTSKLFVTRDRYRRDNYEEGKLRETQWYVQDDEGLTMTSVRFDERNFDVTHDPRPRPDDSSPLDRVKALVKRLNENGRLLGADHVGGRDTMKFQVDLESEQRNSAAMRVWLDQKTKMPARIEHDLPVDASVSNVLKRKIHVQHDFRWSPALPADTFNPRIPEGYVERAPQ